MSANIFKKLLEIPYMPIDEAERLLMQPEYKEVLFSADNVKTGDMLHMKRENKLVFVKKVHKFHFSFGYSGGIDGEFRYGEYGDIITNRGTLEEQERFNNQIDGLGKI